jgi:uncharacterized protein
MTVFCDTSAFYAMGDPQDRSHRDALRIWESLLATGADAVTTNYTVVETISLIQSRYGVGPVRKFASFLSGNVRVEFVDRELHAVAITSCLERNHPRVSFVDHVSFAFMHRYGIDLAFAFDKQFPERGFKEFSPALRGK